MESRFSFSQAARFAFGTLFEHFAFFLLVIFSYMGALLGGTLLISAIFYAPFMAKAWYAAHALHGAGFSQNELAAAAVHAMGGYAGISFIVAFVFSLVLYRFLQLGFTKICFALHDSQKADIKMLFSCANITLNGFVASILYSLVCAIGCIFFILPGIYFAIRYGFYSQFIVDKHLGPLEALQASSTLTQGAKWELFAVSFFILILNSITFGRVPIGFVVTLPVSALMYVYIYRKLLEKQG